MIIAVCNQKGGVGKTTTAINLAGVLSQANHSTLLVDLDAQGHVSKNLAIEIPSDQPSIYEVLKRESPLRDAIVKTKYPNLDIAPADIRLSASDIELSSAKFAGVSTHLLKRALKGHPYDNIIIDCPPSLGVQSVNAIIAADQVLIPLQCEYLAMEGVSDLIQTIESICSTLEQSIEILGVLPSMFQRRTNIHRAVLEEARKQFPRLFPPVKRTVRFAAASMQGIPINYFCRDSELISPYISVMEALK